MATGIRTGDPRGFNKGRSSKFCEDSRVRQTPEEGRRTNQPRRCGNDNKDEDNNPKTLNDKKEWVLRISQSFTAGASPSDCLIPYQGYSLVGWGLTPLQRYSRCIVHPLLGYKRLLNWKSYFKSYKWV